jgi:POT family proton-dependent oligopeptide transporter
MHLLYRRNLCRQGLGFKKSIFGASVMILGNLIIAFSPLHFFIWELHLQLLNRFLQAKYFFNGWELYKVGDSRRDAGFGLFYSELILSIVRGAVCVFRNKSRLRLSYASYQLQLLWLLV